MSTIFLKLENLHFLFLPTTHFPQLYIFLGERNPDYQSINDIKS